MRKIFRALSAGACEKRFVGKEARVPEGWYESPREALLAWQEPKVEATEADVKRGPGRPPKSAA